MRHHPLLAPLSDKPDRTLAIESYRHLAESYDATCSRIEPIRRTSIERLALKPGQTVFDIASGTGKSLPALAAAVGPQGRVIAIEQSPEMAHIAKALIDGMQLLNVEQIVAPVEEAEIGAMADAALFHYTHDVLRSPLALERIFSRLRPQAIVVVAGFRLATGWRAAFNPWFKARARGYLSTLEGIGMPYSYLLRHVPNFQVHEEYFLGSGYIGSGHFFPEEQK